MSTLASRFREVAERFKAHAWKACWVQALEGSNPFLSAKKSHESGISHLKDNRIHSNWSLNVKYRCRRHRDSFDISPIWDHPRSG